ncbi:unnamed protein product [Protopolystoma xenopodis]|uniref:Uncharacterized protein n=1 Tax=Protopolystoma xenopodis TaxID=117903 RepID=A0A3S5CPH0_9PLAT|nr:unnamed protein product [Protopolystoma xenopodis]
MMKRITKSRRSHSGGHTSSTSSSGGGGWFSWLRSGASTACEGIGDSSSAPNASPASDSNELMQRLRSEMTSEEKAKLYEAIGYSEVAATSQQGGGTAGYPLDYVSTSIQFSLHYFNLLSSHCQIFGRSSNGSDQATGFGKCSCVDSFEAIGSRDATLTVQAPNDRILNMHENAPLLITSHISASSERKSEFDEIPSQQQKATLFPTSSYFNAPNESTSLVVPDTSGLSFISCSASTVSASSLLHINFERNPLDKGIEQRITVSADPLQIIYDSETVNRIFHFLEPPKDLRLDE